MSASEIVVAEVKRLRPQPGDVVVIRCGDKVTTDAHQHMAEVVKGVMPEGVKVLITEGNVDVDIAEGEA